MQEYKFILASSYWGKVVIYSLQILQNKRMKIGFKEVMMFPCMAWTTPSNFEFLPRLRKLLSDHGVNTRNCLVYSTKDAWNILEWWILIGSH